MKSTKNRKVAILYFGILLAGGGVNAQSTGFWPDNLSNLSIIKTNTVHAVGIGTGTPAGWAEIFYCPPFGTDQKGLVVTKFDCRFGQTGTNSNGNDGILPEGFGEPQNGAVAWIPAHTFAFSTPSISPSFTLATLNANAEPLIWARTSNPTADETKFIVLPNGQTGINVSNPRAFLDVRSNVPNTAAGLFGAKAIRPGTTVNGIPQFYTKHIAMVPDMTAVAYNTITTNKDRGIIFTDGQGTDGANLEGGLVIAPWNNDPAIGGMRMASNGDVLIKGKLELQGELRCNGFRSQPKWWPDFVFEKEYKLLSLEELAAFIAKNHHLPNMESQEQILKNGQDVPLIQQQQQQKIEELTLYILEQNKRFSELQKVLFEMRSELKILQEKVVFSKN